MKRECSMELKSNKLEYCVYWLWYDALPVTMTEEKARDYIRSGIDEANNPNTIWVGGIDGYDLALSLSLISAERFTEQWNWLNTHQSSDFNDAKEQYMKDK